MYNVLSMTMVDSLEQTAHVSCGLRLCEGLVLLLCYLIKELGAGHIFHHQVDVLLVVVSLVVLDDVRMIELVHDRDLLHDAIDVVAKFHFVHDLNRDLKRAIRLVLRAEDTAECANAEHLGIRVDMVVLLQLVNTLLLIAFADLDIWSRHFTATSRGTIRNALF